MYSLVPLARTSLTWEMSVDEAATVGSVSCVVHKSAKLRDGSRAGVALEIGALLVLVGMVWRLTVKMLM